MTVSLAKDLRVVEAIRRAKDLGEAWGHMHGRKSVPLRDLGSPVYLNGVRGICQVGPMTERPLTTTRPFIEDRSPASYGWIDCEDEYGRYELDYDDPRNMDLYDGI